MLKVINFTIFKENNEKLASCAGKTRAWASLEHFLLNLIIIIKHKNVSSFCIAFENHIMNSVKKI